ncbi:MAG TPA: MauE/DoxX family redox-associated membrane protein [bacterium]|nr:MauE/DoxX family redox-associated membrane protein [bacterium]HPG45439.1 MauE/DoxX family redox-associated membrane protein [bacterium]HPM96785.1 MauE/DoxX family redox-associated membrane protein [bacterium]
MNRHKPWVETAVRWILALVFFFAGVPKIADPGTFAQAIDNYRLLPYFAVIAMAIFLPWLEVILGLALASGRLRRGTALLTALLYLMFLVAIGSAVMRGLDIDCGCFGTGHRVDLWRIAEDVLLLAGAVWLYCRALSDHPKPENSQAN